MYFFTLPCLVVIIMISQKLTVKFMEVRLYTVFKTAILPIIYSD